MNEEEADHPAVLSYRVGQVEATLQALNTKLDTILSMYPTEAAVMRMIKPVEDDVQELKNIHQREAQNKASMLGQFKIALTIAIASPVLTIAISIFIADKLPG